jgi:hypothetical protein
LDRASGLLTQALSNGVLTVNPLFERLLDGERLFA